MSSGCSRVCQGVPVPTAKVTSEPPRTNGYSHRPTIAMRHRMNWPSCGASMRSPCRQIRWQVCVSVIGGLPAGSVERSQCKFRPTSFPTKCRVLNSWHTLRCNVSMMSRGSYRATLYTTLPVSLWTRAIQIMHQCFHTCMLP